jgi:hypothetical protein
MNNKEVCNKKQRKYQGFKVLPLRASPLSASSNSVMVGKQMLYNFTFPPLMFCKETE